MEKAKVNATAALRKSALEAFNVGVAAADPEVALKRTLDRKPIPQIKSTGCYFIVSVGKAACKMANYFIKKLPEGSNFNAIAITNFENVIPVKGCEVMGASHPVPCEKGLFAAREVISRLEKATKFDIIIMLVSGGASALLPAPVNEISLHDKIHLNKILLVSGLNIYQMNLVRQSISRLKGGGVLRFAAPAQVHSYILSDVLGDDLSVIGSGPSIAPLGSVADARRLMINKGLFTKLPLRIRLYLENASIPKLPTESINAHLIASNSNSVLAMAKAVGATVITKPLMGDVQAAVNQIIDTLKSLNKTDSFAIAFGGETTVKIKGDGKGGRNQELALRFAIEAEGLFCRPWCFLSGGTDGIDGPTNSAGGVVDHFTLDKIRCAGGDINKLLENNDSYNALKLSDDLILTGATGTNVADLQLFIVGPLHSSF